MTNNEAKIALLDVMTISTYQNKLKGMGLHVQEVVDSSSSYGMVLSGELVRLEREIRSYISSEKNKITKFGKSIVGDIEVMKT